MTFSAIRSLIIAALIILPCAGQAQDQSANSSPAASKKLLKPEQIAALVAPIALYPDNLLSEVLMASTYPLEVVQAERWLKANKDLKGDALEKAVEEQPWDDSVKSLVATPSVLEMMNAKLDWTQKLGNAVVDQQADVMDAIQRLRAKAQANNKLQSNKQQTVSVSQQQGRQVISIAPADPNTVYVPYYDPGVVYGAWPYPEYPAYYWPAPYYIGAALIATGLAFGAGYALGRWANNYWGGNVNWNNNNITVNRPGAGGGGNWNRGAHVEHRLGNRGGRENGLNFRGNNGQRVLNPGGGRGNVGGNRPNVGERPRAGQHPNFGNRGGNRAHAAQRPAGGGRHNAGNRGGGRAHAAQRPSRGGGRPHVGGGGGMRAHGGGGGLRAHGGGGMRAHGGGGHRGGGGRGGGRRSDIRLKHDIVYLGTLDDGLAFYRFSYNGGSKAYVGVMAQDVQHVAPQAVFAGRDGYLRVDYDRLGLKFETYRQWLRSGAQLPATVRTAH